MPTLFPAPCPRGQVVVSTPEVMCDSGCPGALLSICRKRLISCASLSKPAVSGQVLDAPRFATGNKFYAKTNALGRRAPEAARARRPSEFASSCNIFRNATLVEEKRETIAARRACQQMEF